MRDVNACSCAVRDEKTMSICPRIETRSERVHQRDRLAGRTGATPPAALAVERAASQCSLVFATVAYRVKMMERAQPLVVRPLNDIDLY